MRKIVHSDKAPKAIGPYSQAISTGNLQFCSGQIPLDPATMKLVGETAAEQCHQVMKNLSSVLEAGGSSLANIVKTTIYLADMNDFAAVNEVYGSYLQKAPPARATVEVSRLPMDVKVEIDAIALCD